MLEFVKKELAKYNIFLVSSLSLGECEISRPYLLERNGISPDSGSAVLFAVPYLTRESVGERNISAYAVSRDYHIFFKELFSSLLPCLSEKYPEHRFVGFSDHSPINEIDAAVLCGLGVKGKNHLLITEKYSSYVFLGEIITDMKIPSHAGKFTECIGCGKCIRSCPAGGDISACLSSLTQKKGELCEEEKKKIKAHGCAWGCDVCQEVCPYTAAALNSGSIFTEIEFFTLSAIPKISSETVENMTDTEFSERAYSWRKRETILRNLRLLEEDK